MFSFKHFNWPTSVDLFYKGSKSVRVIELARSSHKPLMAAACASLLFFPHQTSLLRLGLTSIDHVRWTEASVSQITTIVFLKLILLTKISHTVLKSRLRSMVARRISRNPDQSLKLDSLNTLKAPLTNLMVLRI